MPPVWVQAELATQDKYSGDALLLNLNPWLGQNVELSRTSTND